MLAPPNSPELQSIPFINIPNAPIKKKELLNIDWNSISMSNVIRKFKF